ncbi:hypothetical protein KFE25_005123 [Diacronema lutheri]|uniref:Major facilitator superfamily (MFS) profile domain-containing protein n=2 Tax=Diacronema lutheri TaxID=2081491 RepID=A0A8J6C1T7_DIALT|nr:hypothetical protein KFE25_005123 [Diacronema lutheri]
MSATSTRSPTGHDAPASTGAAPRSTYAQFDTLDIEAAAHDERADVNYRFLLQACAVLGLSGLIYGYDIGVISGALPVMSARFALTPVEEGLVVSLLAMGSACGGVLAGLVCDRVGRKRTVHVQNVLFAVGTLCIASAQVKSIVMFGRFVLGVGAAFSAVASLAYLCELAPLPIRGWVTSAYEVLVVTGILVAWVADYAFARREDGWRWMFGCILLAVITQTIGIFQMPESPRWLLARGDARASRRAIRRAFTSEGAADSAMRRLQQEELLARASDAAVLAADVASASAARAPHWPLAASPTATSAAPAAGCARALAGFAKPLWLWRHSLSLGVLIGLCMHFSGGVTVLNFAGEIFLRAGIDAERGGQFLIYLGLVKFGVTFVSIGLVDTAGRRPLLLGGICSMAVGMAVLAWACRQPPSATSLLPLGGCVLVIVGYAFSYGPLAWLLWAELFPTAHRGEMIGLVSFLSNLCMFVNNFLFAPLGAALGSLAPVFAAYATANVAALLLLGYLLPETRGALAEGTRDELRRRFACAGIARALGIGGGGRRVVSSAVARGGAPPRAKPTVEDARAPAADAHELAPAALPRAEARDGEPAGWPASARGASATVSVPPAPRA